MPGEYPNKRQKLSLAAFHVSYEKDPDMLPPDFHMPEDLPQFQVAFAIDNIKRFVRRGGVYVANQARRDRVEVRLRDLDAGQLKLFQEAKHKEINEWLKHETIEVIKRNHPDVIARCSCACGGY